MNHIEGLQPGFPGNTASSKPSLPLIRPTCVVNIIAEASSSDEG
jgi:hypothetical protein